MIICPRQTLSNSIVAQHICWQRYCFIASLSRNQFSQIAIFNRLRVARNDVIVKTGNTMLGADNCFSSFFCSRYCFLTICFNCPLSFCWNRWRGRMLLSQNLPAICDCVLAFLSRLSWFLEVWFLSSIPERWCRL